MIRFHLDQHIDSAVARGLRLRGIDVTTTAEAGLQDAMDEDHVDFALRENRVIVTHDADFLRLHGEGRPHAGIVYGEQGKVSVGELIRFLELLARCVAGEEIKGRVEFL